MTSYTPTVRRALALCGLALLVAVASPVVAAADTNRHTVTFGLGYQSFMSDDFENSGFESAGMGNLSYHYTVNPTFDVAFDSRMSFSGEDETVDFGGGPTTVNTNYSTKWFGPGVRYNFGTATTRPYMQANLYYVSESLSMEMDGVSASDSESGVGFGFQGGMDIHLSRTMSMPVEMNFMTASPANDLTSVGAQAGLAFHFGGM
jgi:hypothetical protein